MTNLCKDNVCTLSSEPYLKVRDLTVSYQQRKVLDRISLDFAACGVAAIIGPSGAGKSSFLSCLNRLSDLNPDCRVEGSIRLQGEEIFDRNLDLKKHRRRVGMVFQKPNPFPLSLWQNLAWPLDEHFKLSRNEKQLKIEKALRDVGLWDEVKDRLQDSALSLSGGQQQRLCLARCLILEPELLLLDEPCSALDPLSTQHIEQLIRSLRSQLQLVIVTHNLAQARRVSDQVALFWNINGIGRLIECGPTDTLMDRPQSQEAQAYVSGLMG